MSHIQLIPDAPSSSPEWQLAYDEALFHACERGDSHEILRFWEPTGYSVILGYSNKMHDEANLFFCSQNGIPVFRRFTGGGTVLQMPGCLNYTLILKMNPQTPTGQLRTTNRYIMERVAKAIECLGTETIEVCGCSDLAIEGVKVSGNAQRRGRHFLIFHGCLLLDANLSMVEKTLHLPSHQPDYRRKRSHAEFIRNLNLPPVSVRDALQKEWGAVATKHLPPVPDIEGLVRTKYLNPEWTGKF